MATPMVPDRPHRRFRRRRRAARTGTRPDRHRPVTTRPPRAGRLSVAVAPMLASLGPGLEFTSRGRVRCDVAMRDADVVLVAPCSPGTLHGLRQRLQPSVDLVVFDRRRACAPELVADMLDGGASAVVSSPSSAVLVAYLDALARRRR